MTHREVTHRDTESGTGEGEARDTRGERDFTFVGVCIAKGSMHHANRDRG